jgi:iron complex outermembrane receptor protein
MYVPGYVTLDLRYAHKIGSNLELALSGRNLVGQRRVEYVTDYVPATPVLIAPSAFVTARWKF